MRHLVSPHQDFFLFMLASLVSGCALSELTVDATLGSDADGGATSPSSSAGGGSGAKGGTSGKGGTSADSSAGDDDDDDDTGGASSGGSTSETGGSSGAGGTSESGGAGGSGGTTSTIAGWTCSSSYYGAGDGCDCGCGIVDPDCADSTRASCNYRYCSAGTVPAEDDNATCVAVDVPDGWTCTATTYADNYCHCGCGVIDIDCSNNTDEACYYYRCDTGYVPAVTDNTTCQCVRYVDVASTAAAADMDGSSWSTAYSTLQAGLDAAGADSCQVWVKAGKYVPTSVTDTTDDRTATFQLVSGVLLYGGFDGTETYRTERDVAQNISLLTGELDDDAVASNNAYHVVIGAEGAVLDGFTITAGNADGSTWPNYAGGGLFNPTSASPTVANCTFSENSATYGAAIQNYYASPTISGCTFSGNSATYGGAVHNEEASPTLTGCTFEGDLATYGGEIYNYNASPSITNSTFSSSTGADFGGALYNNGSSPTITNCTFQSNSAVTSGGAIYNESGSSPVLSGCTFSGNSALYGGALYNYESAPVLSNCTLSSQVNADYGGVMFNNLASPKVSNCVFENNAAATSGGVMYNEAGASPVLTNCTFAGSSATYGGVLYNYSASNPTVTNCTFTGNSAVYGGVIENDASSPVVVNSILWGNTATSAGPALYDSGDCYPSVSFSVIEGGYSSGTGIITEDPLLSTDSGVYSVGVGSSAIDAGSSCSEGVTLTDLAGNSRWDIASVENTGSGAAVDIGAYEYQGVSGTDTVISSLSDACSGSGGASGAGGSGGSGGASSGGASGEGGAAGAGGVATSSASCLASISSECSCSSQVTNSGDTSVCETIIECYLANDCSPTDSACIASDGTCGTNALGASAAQYTAAAAVYTCACSG